MRSQFEPDRKERAQAAAAAAVIHFALGAAFFTGLAMRPELRPEDPLKTFDVKEEPPPPPPVVPRPDPASDKAAPAGKKAEPSPIVAPPARIPIEKPIQAAPIAGVGASPNAGAADRGSGIGAGGSGAGRGGGGSGGSGAGTPAHLLSGNRARLSRTLLRPLAGDRGFAHLLLTVAATGRVTACGVLQGTGRAEVDQAICAIMVRQHRWAPARDTSGRPITVEIRYTAVWSKD